MEMVRCLLFEKDLPKKFWAEAVNTVVFLLNRLPIRALQNKTSYEAWHGYKPSLQNLKISGCLCFTYVPQVKKDNLIERLKLIFLSVIAMLQKAIEFFNLKQKKVIVSKDIKFIETEKSNFKDVERSASKEIVQDLGDYVDEAPVRGTILLDDIYQSAT
jgi:hypothetical protein